MKGHALHDERGSITAEFAVVLPAVLMVLVLAVGSIMLSAQQVVLVAAAAEIARLEARDDQGAARARLDTLGFAVTVRRSEHGALHCVHLAASPGGGLLAALEISARACAARTEATR
ncbi:MAG: pilus assembly protein [Leucobacter sp.]|nr:pilus assembly protein [Leucobacter sp.]